MLTLLKPFLPYILTAAIALGAGSAGTLYIAKAVKPEVKVSCPQCPDLKCPAIPPANGIDFDKIKNVKGLTIQNHQYYVMDGDTVTITSIQEALRVVIREQKIARCK